MASAAVLVCTCFSAAGEAPALAPPKTPQWIPDLLTGEEASTGFYPLFNGENLDGWQVRGPNNKAFAVESGGVLRVTDVPSGATASGSWLFTDCAYENFVLRLEYRLATPKAQPRIAVHAAAQGDAGAAGLAVNLLDPAQPPAANTWNQVDILCEGAHYRTMLNGRTLDDIRPAQGQPAPTQGSPNGSIAIQHAGGPVEYRRIRILPLPGGEGLRALFNGKDLDGWQVLGEARWEVLPEGILRVSGVEGMGRSELRTVEEFGDFELSLWVRPHANPAGGAKSAVFFRGSGERPWPLTYEVAIDNHAPEQFTGAIVDQVRACELRAMDDRWNHLIVSAHGALIRVQINGKVVVDYISAKHPKCPRGWISLQGYDASSVIDFRDIEIRPIPKH